MIAQVDLLELGYRPLKRSEYDKLVELGVFEDEKVELLYGRLVPMSPQKSLHAHATHALGKRLARLLGDRAEVRVQMPLALSDTSEPEPDVAVVPPGAYWDGHPTTAWLVVEVAESSTKKDREVKSRLYAEAGVLEYWLVDLKASFVEVFRDVSDGVYRSARALRRGESLAMAHFPDVAVSVDDVLPPPAGKSGNGGSASG